MRRRRERHLRGLAVDDDLSLRKDRRRRSAPRSPRQPSGPRPTVGFDMCSASATGRDEHVGSPPRRLPAASRTRTARGSTGSPRRASRAWRHPAASGPSASAARPVGRRRRDPSARPSVHSPLAAVRAATRRWIRRRPGGRASPGRAVRRRRPAVERGEAGREQRRPDRLGPRGRAVPVLVHPAGRQLAPPGTRRSRATNAVERQGRLDAADLGLVERAPEPVDGRVAVAGVDHELGDQVVVLGRRPGPRPRSPCRRGRPGPAGITQRPTRPGRRGEVAGRVLGRDADLDRVARRRRRALGRGERRRATAARPAASRNCSRTMSSAGHELGHAVLHLEPRVDLEEPEARRPARGGTRPSRRCAGRPPRRAGPPAPWRCAALRRRSGPGAGASSTSFWWRRWSEQSRSPRATTRPVRVAEQLDLDVARRAGSPARGRPTPSPNADAASRDPPTSAAGRSAAARDPPHPASAAAGRRLDQQREADPPRPRRRSPRPGRAGRPAPARACPGPTGDAGVAREPPGVQLVAERLDRVGRRADERRARRPRRPGRTPPARRGTRSPGWIASAPVASAASTIASIRR